MKLVALAMAGVLRPAVRLRLQEKSHGCRQQLISENPASSTPTADASKSSASVPASAPGARATAPYNPTLKVPPPGPPVVINGVTINVQNAERALATVHGMQMPPSLTCGPRCATQDYRRPWKASKRPAA